jgi:hypothetical protein
VSEPSPRDYPEWTQYSWGNDHGWRRIYCGHLLYAFDDTFHWHVANQKPFREYQADSFEAAKSAAERWAEDQL